MNKKNLPLLLIAASLLLITFNILNVLFTSEEMDLRFWMQISSNIFLILAMIVTIRDQKKNSE